MAGGNEGEDTDMTMAHVAMDILEIMTIDMIIKIEAQAMVNQKENFQILEEEVKIIRFEGDKDNGMVTTQTMTGIIGIEILMVKIILTEAEDGKVIEVKEIVIGGRGENGVQIHNINNKDIHNNLNFLILITIACHQWATNTSTPYCTTNIPCTHNQTRNIHHQDHQCNRAKQQTSVNCAKIRVTMTINVNLQVTL